MRWWGAQAGGGVRAARAGGGGRAARAEGGEVWESGERWERWEGEKGKTLSEFWDFDKVYWIFIARVEGFEPPSTVLETAILPLNYTRILKKF